MNQLKNKVLGILLILFFGSAPMALRAQHIAKADLEPVAQKGFYRIVLNPDIRALCDANGKDLRLLDDKGREIAYLLEELMPAVMGHQFTPYPVSGQFVDGPVQYLTIENKDKSGISSIMLEVSNASARRKLSISGSDDLQTWYAVRDEFDFDLVSDQNVPMSYRMLSFPVTDYRYYKIAIRNDKKQALNIVRAGYLKQAQSMPPPFNRVNTVSFTQTDSNDRHSYLRLGITPANSIRRIELFISSPALYYRNAMISLPLQAGAASGNTVSGTAFTLSSGKQTIIEPEFLTGNLKCTAIDIKIDNQDNIPLVIDSIHTYQSAITLVAELAPDLKYALYFGDTGLKAPQYDLIHFRDKIPGGIQEVHAGALVPVQSGDTLKETQKDDKGTLLVWSGLITAGIAIAYMCGRMMKDMKKNGDE